MTMAYDNEDTEKLIMTTDEFNDSKCSGFWCQLFLSFFGIALLCTGITIADLWPQIYGDIMKNNLELKNNTQTFKYWQQIPAPLYLNIYLFNWTNPEATLKEGAKPILEQLGPYVFKENRTKVNPIFNDNNYTITYMQLKSWQFEPTLSNGSLSDQVTTVNIILNVLGEKLQTANKNWLLITLTNYFLKMTNIKSPYVTKTAGEFIFHGYDDLLLDIVLIFKSFFNIDIPFDRVGWFYGMNMSTRADGRINMFTGLDDIGKVGIVHSVNYAKKLNVFNKDCSITNASAGDLWPEHSAKQSNISIYIPSICSALTMKSKKFTYVNDVKGVEFVGESDVFNNSCYRSSSEHLLPGVRSLKLCGDNAPPLYISYPHFYLADSSYRDSIIGMNPNQTLHEFKMILENDYSIPLSVDARLQFSAKLNPIEELTAMKNLPKVFLPVFWISESFEIPRNISDQLLIIKNVVIPVISYTWLIIIIMGFLIIILSSYLWVRKNIYGAPFWTICKKMIYY